MASKQLNIRVDDELNKKLELLRERGYNTSMLIRLTLHKMADELLVTDKQA